MTPDEIDGAYVLARLGYRDLALETWRDIAHRASGRVLIAREGDGRASGLLIYAISPTLAGRPDLRVERLIAFGLLDARKVADALLREVMTIAERRNCASFSLATPLDAPETAAALVLASPVATLHSVV
ncbi:MAG: hypothetical protein QM698_08140 [Micropepsaceae bacterium]